MTTKVKIECPDNSHWHIKVDVQDQVYDHEAKAMTDDWRVTNSFVLKQTESHETYVHSSRRLLLTEIVPA